MLPWTRKRQLVLTTPAYGFPIKLRKNYNFSKISKKMLNLPERKYQDCNRGNKGRVATHQSASCFSHYEIDIKKILVCTFFNQQYETVEKLRTFTKN